MGGSKQPTFVQAPAQPPAPSTSESAKDIYETRVQYDPKIAAMEYELAKQYGPLYGSLFSQVAEEQFPGIEALRKTGADLTLANLKSAYGMDTDDPFVRAETERLRRQMRETRNIGGGLYSGRGLTAEDKAVENLQQAFRTEAQQRTIPYLQILYPQVSQVPAVSRETTPDPSALYNALYGSSRREYGFQPGSPSPWWGVAGQFAGGLGAGLGAGAKSSIRYKKNIKLWAKLLI